MLTFSVFVCLLPVVFFASFCVRKYHKKRSFHRKLNPWIITTVVFSFEIKKNSHLNAMVYDLTRVVSLFVAGTTIRLLQTKQTST